MSRRIASSVSLVLLAVLAALPACSGGGSKRALALYHQGQFPEALREGEQVAQSAGPPESDKAALVAGMSAYELKKYSEAERWLRTASRSSDAAVAGRASATLGLVNVARERYSTAALDFSAAGRRLEGDEAARAHFFAGECYSILGRIDAAARSYEQARLAARDPALRSRVGNRMSSSGFTLQLGAFANRANADKALAAGGQRASKAGLPTPTIVATPDATGRTIYLVQAGKFSTKEEAAVAKSKLGGDCVVVQMR
ncbi:MAG: SPOR domain-containing protein [Phycisphaerae bacterium]|nr:SPOR domain-containing protein [Phycisphaerae bacterium]